MLKLLRFSFTKTQHCLTFNIFFSQSSGLQIQDYSDFDNQTFHTPQEKSWDLKKQKLDTMILSKAHLELFKKCLTMYIIKAQLYTRHDSRFKQHNNRKTHIALRARKVNKMKTHDKCNEE